MRIIGASRYQACIRSVNLRLKESRNKCSWISFQITEWWVDWHRFMLKNSSIYSSWCSEEPSIYTTYLSTLQAHISGTCRSISWNSTCWRRNRWKSSVNLDGMDYFWWYITVSSQYSHPYIGVILEMVQSPGCLLLWCSILSNNIQRFHMDSRASLSPSSSTRVVQEIYISKNTNEGIESAMN